MVKDAHIVRLVERIGEHYRENISNRFLRPALFQIHMDRQNWDLLDTLTEKSEQYKDRGYYFDELYRQIIAAAHFVSYTRRDIAPSLRNRLPVSSSDQDKILKNMAVNNFSSNLKLFADLINELYICLVDIDKENAKKNRRPPIYASIPGLQDIGSLLVGSPYSYEYS